jgi:hypothetical protein
MAFLSLFFSRANVLRLAVAGAVAVAVAIVVTGVVAIARTTEAAPAAAAARVPAEVTTPTPDPAPAAAAPAHAAGSPAAGPPSHWDRLAHCESSGNWAADTGNGFSGGLQFTRSTWRAYGGHGEARDATRHEQITVAERVLADQGWDAWPACSAKLGLQ